MLDSIRSLLDAFPEGIILARTGAVLDANVMARHYLPHLTPGNPLPDCFLLPEDGDRGAGVFVSGSVPYTYSCAPDGEDRVILFRPAPQTALNGRQLGGVLQQLRELLSDILMAAGPEGTLSAASFNKSFHRLFRLIGNVEYLEQAGGEAGMPFRPITIDLAGLCRHVTQQAGDLLKEAGITLEYRSRERSLLIPGDPGLLEKLLLGLLSNSARAAGERGKVLITLHRRGDWAYLAVTNSGAALGGAALAALLREGPGEELPLPGQGAGLGLTIARHITTLHGGSFLTQLDDSAPKVLISLPAGSQGGRVGVHTPTFHRDGGLNLALMELSDVLPTELFGMEDLD